MTEHQMQTITGNLSCQEAIVVAKSKGISVGYDTTPGCGEGFYSSSLAGGYRIGPCPSEDVAWQQVAEKMALVKPGVTVFTSREYSEVSRVNTLCSDGSLGVSSRRSRVEVRSLDNHYELFIVERLYKPGEAPRDIWQTRHAHGDTPYLYASLDEAKEATDQYIGGFEETEAEETGYSNRLQRPR